MEDKTSISKAKFKALLSKIILTHYPDEHLTFEISGEAWINQLHTNESLTDESKKGLFNFLEEAKTILECITLIIGTYKTAKELKKKGDKKPEAEKVIELWTQNLVDEGVAPEKAAAIAAKFYNDLNPLIMHEK